LALEFREEIALGPLDPLDPWELAALYGVDVYGLDDVGCSREALDHFALTRPQAFSGALVPLSTGAAIIENTAHPLVRRRSTMSHEMAHVTLEHLFSATLVNEQGCRNAEPDQEDEATELSGELLLPFDAAIQLARRRVTNEAVAEQFGVSIAFARWRMNSTGARKIADRQAAAYRKKIGR
jgi:hypothetical protein